MMPFTSAPNEDVKKATTYIQHHRHLIKQWGSGECLESRPSTNDKYSSRQVAE
ncbi:predicted protein [Plenodomus lingam JN3]|uniref:Predicted protein n=1 Tax=Leptosphaeria maculans (strain JN3 / isolate v23.1.3 / race Av1-4-5-6-7-8) TaxID=985895 RepID=E5AAT9_LEPMJ|nr:predicted protein [Plenodomus lingam JN3]CBY00780.1 predicted protein [Plenodomus lingam JN3]